MEPLPISAINHYAYCPRRFAWIHIEREFVDNEHTTRGNLGHQRVDQVGDHLEAGVRVLRALDLWSDRWGLVGKADVVEILEGDRHRPVEYKAGPKESWENDDLQVAAQAVCLEEMFGRPVPEAQIFHIASRRRRTIQVDDPLRERLNRVVGEMRALRDSGTIPPNPLLPHCSGCSFRALCMPEAKTSPKDWLFRPLPEVR
jgi:CRISPR-associated exonuclease Cas4